MSVNDHGAGTEEKAPAVSSQATYSRFLRKVLHVEQVLSRDCMTRAQIAQLLQSRILTRACDPSWIDGHEGELGLLLCDKVPRGFLGEGFTGGVNDHSMFGSDRELGRLLILVR